ncbi:MAG TPA: hypothetical protein VH601_25320 [Bryobacteraceae bacterium]
MRINQIYRALLQLYPADYRKAFAAEMLGVFEKAALEHAGKRAAFGRFATAELFGLITGAGAEWIARFTMVNSIRRRSALGICAQSGGSAVPEEVIQAQDRVSSLVGRIVHAIANHDFPAARSYAYEESKERENLRLLRERYGLEK